MKKRVLILALMAAIILTLLPANTALAATEVGDFQVETVGTLGIDYTYADNVLTFKAGTFDVQMKSGVTQTPDRIVVDPQPGCGANITLKNINIDVSGLPGVCAFDVKPGVPDTLGLVGHAVIKLEGVNRLASGSNMPGLHMPNGAFVDISESGSLTANGGSDAAGIGGGPGEGNGFLRINDGSITASGGANGAGIGGGKNGLVSGYSTVIVNGGNVTAEGGINAAGIGGGQGMYGCFVTITGGSVTANGGLNGAGVGGGQGSNGNIVEISGGSVYAAGSGGQDIGCGSAGSGGSLSISGTAKVFLLHDSCSPVSPTTHTHNTLTGAHTGDIVFGGVTLPWDGDYGAYLPLYILSYNVNGGSGTPPDSIEQLAGTGAMVAGGTGLSREHYSFNGWNSQSDGDGVPYSPGGTFTFDANTTLYAQWLGDAYTVTFDAQGGTVPNQQEVRYGGTYGELPTPERTDYLFGGWYTEPEGAGSIIYSDSVFESTSNPTLYAKWFANACTVTFDPLGGTVLPDSKVVAYGYSYGELPVPVRSGYKFFGWFPQADCTGGQITADTIVSNDQDHTLFAKWANSFTVTFDAQGGSPATQIKTVELNSTMTSPAAPTRSNYSFKGWYREPECIKAWYFATNIVTDNITLYAKWTPRTYKVYFDPRNGSDVTYEYVNYDALVTKPADPTRKGYDFDKWYKDSACTNAWAFDTDHMPAKNITLYAKWNIHKWNVTFDGRGGEFDPGVTSLVRNDVAYHSLIPAPLIPTRAHYTYKGWYKDTACTHPWYFSESRTPDSDLTLYVKWSAEKFTVKFNSQGGTKVYSKTGYWDRPIAKPTNPTHTGYTFGGWYKDAGCTDDWVFSGEGADTVTANITLYAKWTAKTYTVTFNPSGGTIDGNPTASVTADYGETISRPTTPVKSGYYFGGWYTSKYFTTQWNFGKPVTKSMTLYAKWMKSQYKITFKANASGVTNLPAPIYAECYDMPLEPAQPTKTGYIFGGWYKSSTHFTNANKFNFGTTMLTGSVTLYARWIPAQYKVTFSALGGTPTPPAQTIDLDHNVIEPTAPTKTGYCFGGWYTSSTYFTDKYKWDFGSKTVTKNMTLYARWVKTLSTPKVTAVAITVEDVTIRCSTVPYATNYTYECARSAHGPWDGWTRSSSEITIGGLDTDRTYYFRVKAYCVAGGVKISSGYSPIVHESPGKPTCLAAAATSYNEINVSFSNSGIYRKTGYEIWRSTSLKGEYICVGTIPSYMESPEIHSFDDIGVATGKTYYYKVRAYKQVGALKTHGAFSDIVWARATLEIPDWFIAGGSGATSVTASWNAVDGASGYELWRATAVSGVFKLLKCTTALSYKNTSLVTDQPYYYKVRAYRYVSDKKVYSGFTEVKIATPSDF